MDTRFDDVFTSPVNQVFKVAFYPDRIYHAQYLNATRSPRFRYNVSEVRNQADICVMKGEVYLDGRFLSTFLRVEYRAARLVEQAREKDRLLHEEVLARIRLLPADPDPAVEARVALKYCRWVDCYQVEIWETLEPPDHGSLDFQVLDMMGSNGEIIRIPGFSPALRNLKRLNRVELSFREALRDAPSGYAIDEDTVAWDENFFGTYQEPRTDAPSHPDNTVPGRNYLIDFRRGYFLDTAGIRPVRYRNAMMEPSDPDWVQGGNEIHMRWILQRELGGSLVFFHEVTIPPGRVEGTHQHIGTEELYYIIQGHGTAYMAEGDDPATDGYPTVIREVFGVGPKRCKALPVAPGHVIYTKSGGVHGIRNEGPDDLKFVAFLYHCS